MKDAKELVKFIDEGCSGAFIEKMLLIGAARNGDVADLIEHVDDDRLTDTFAGIDTDAVTDRDFCKEEFLSKGYYGLVAVCGLPIPQNVKTNEQGKVISCSRSEGYYTSFLAYGDTFGELANNIRIKALWLFYQYAKKDLKKQK